MTNAIGTMFCILNGNSLETAKAECMTNLHLEDKTLCNEAEERNKLFLVIVPFAATFNLKTLLK